MSVTDNDVLLPDSKFYSVRGRYISCLLNGYDKRYFDRSMVPPDSDSGVIFMHITQQSESFPRLKDDENNFFAYIVGSIYFIFGYFPLGVRIFNIALSILASYFTYSIAKRQFDDVTANIVLGITLFLPTQIVYSITLSKDFIRMFLLMLIMWLIYGGVMCRRISKKS